MKTTTIMTRLGLLVLVSFALAGGLYAQDDEPDLQILDSDIVLSPSERVKLKSMVQVSADVQNVENCYVVMSETDDAIGFDISYEPYDVFKVSLRARSSNGIWIDVQVRMDYVTSYPFAVVDSDWAQCTCQSFNAPYTSNCTMYIERSWGGAGSDLEIDWIKVYRYVYPSGYELIASWEAEDYEDGGDTVDWIHPCNTQVNFYDGDPDAGGSIFASVPNVGNLERTIESGTIWILTEDGKQQASAMWKAKPLGWHQLFVEAVPCEREMVTENNRASKEIEVVLMYFRILSFFTKFVPW
jgi:hypothetical protein